MAKNNNLKDFLADVADAIREKEGSSGLINPQDFSAKIRAIQGGGEGGGGAASASAGAVNFRDYDGTILHSYSKDEFLALAEFPALPTQKGLTCQGWNYTIEDAKAYVQECGRLEVGATYITDDGKTRLYIRIADKGRMNVPLCFMQTKSYGVTIDWGDGSATKTFSGAGIRNSTHTYADKGDYVITLEVVDGCTLTLGNDTASYCIVGSTNNEGKVYCNMLQKVEVGKGVTSISAYTFYYCYSLSLVTIPNGVTSISSYAFNYCYSLSSVVIPNGVTSIGDSVFNNCNSLSSVVIPNSVTSISTYAFQACYSLSSVVIPNSVTSIGSNAFNNCNSLSSVVIPNGVTSIGSNAFNNCNSLSSVVIPNGVTSISRNAFNNCNSLSSVVIPNSVTSIESNAFKQCYGVPFFDFRTFTSIPTLSSYNAFSSIASDAKIVVPDELYDEWIAATNWSNSNVSKYIIKASEFNG